ncbi:thiopeptide-type bacteriocin biosynthesis domain-containing protein [Actinopolyspora xinjiangensis]|uniref:Thiopeptide-type bacteriocin biosynthesis domain-containing protein n=1 Tax=Actinopolyspora xinjiangensis TaxID=405564 RepID=A0A1H0X0J1_9ACTN|nr:thiopeptide-type bacteriocin biosynthesis protein [Actinopolyspora xinjiangensis]SDP96471.1 thiopeptide-type bacteriocin biosynthesis domain-containing protein [Actinopolyspora xinjiangensis]
MTPSWRQLNVRFDDWDTVEHTAVTHLGPALTEASHAGLIEAWFFTRKAEQLHPDGHGVAAQGAPRPCWRVRIQGPDEDTVSEALALLHAHLPRATPVIYEPEVHAFGGATGMALAHTLFHQDSHHILTYLNHLDTAPRRVQRKELAMLLCSRLFRAAGQDWYEQGDIWARIAQNRRPIHELPPETVHALHPALRRLMTVDTAQLARDPTSGLAVAADWFTAFDDAGTQLARLAHEGVLERGLRAVLAHHALFAFNRFGLSPASQTLLAHTAATLVFD